MSLLLAAICLSALLAITVEWHTRRPAFYLLKPLTTLLIIVLAYQGSPGDYRNWVLVALGLSLLGDICLMFEGNAWFMGGLGSFLLAHGVFIGAYLAGVGHPLPPWWSAGFVLYGLAFFGWLLPKTGALKLPVLVYGSALMGMALAASARWVEAPSHSALLALLGAGVFVVSDSTLAIRKFNGPYPLAQPVILSSYWLAITLIALSVAA